MKKCIITAAVIFTACVAGIVGCKESPRNATIVDVPEKIGTWYGQIFNVYLAQAQDTVDHTFYLALWDDSIYSINDSIRLHTSGEKVYIPIEVGDWTKSESTYTFCPTKCVDQNQNTGQLSAAACTTASYTGSENDTIITIPHFLNEPVDLVLTRH